MYYNSQRKSNLVSQMKISDIIEKFIIDIIGDGNSAEISRNELAVYFRCAPSQINYVLQTRFTVERGYRVESRRGGGGCIKIEKLAVDTEPYLYGLLETVKEPVSYTKMQQILECMTEAGILSDEGSAVLSSATSDKALASPSNCADAIRSNILRETIAYLLKR